MQIDEALCKAVVGTVPHWFEANHGLFPTNLQIGTHERRFFAVQDLEDIEKELIEFAQDEAQKIINSGKAGRDSTPSEEELLTRRMAEWWLEQRDASVQWKKLLSYSERLRYRTYENDPVSFNAVISEESGKDDITEDDEQIQKILDPLSTSTQVYFRLDKEMKLISYEEVSFDDLSEPRGYNRCPEFIRPVTGCLVEKDKFSFHRTRRGDIIITDDSGILVSWRKGRWYLYDTELLTNTLVQALNLTAPPNEPEVDVTKAGDHLLDIIFDLSYKRHGALLVYDPSQSVVKNGVTPNSQALFNSNSLSTPRLVLRNSLGSLKLYEDNHDARKKRRLLEAASLDGAVIFDLTQVYACGAMIISQEAGAFAGARTTAAYAARDLSGIPIKISSDGDVTILFESSDTNGQIDSRAKLHFA